MRWESVLGFVDVIPGTQLRRPIDVLFDERNRLWTFFDIGRTYDPYFSPPDFVRLDRAISALPDSVGFRVHLLVDPPPACPLDGRRALARRNYDYCREVVARQVRCVLALTTPLDDRPRTARTLEALASVVRGARDDGAIGRLLMQAVDRLVEAAAALGEAFDPRPLGLPEYAAFFTHFTYGQPLPLDIGRALYGSGTLDGEGGRLAAFLPCGDARTTSGGTVELVTPGGLDLVRTVVASEYVFDLASDFFYEVLARYPWPLRATLECLPVRPGFEMTLMKVRMNVLQALAGFGWVAGQLEREVQSSNTKQSYLKIITEGARIWRVGLRFNVSVPAGADPKVAEAELDRRTTLLLSVLRRRGIGARVERLRQPWAFVATLPAATVDEQRLRRLMTENVSCILPTLWGRTSWRGDDHDVFLLSRLHVVDAFDPIEGAGANRNLIVTGGSGSGKSFFLQYVLASLLEKYGDRIFQMIVEAGWSYRRFVQAAGGEVVRVGVPGSPALDPIVGVRPDDEASVLQYATMLAQMARLGGAQLPESRLYDLVNEFFSRYGHGESVRTADFIEAMGLDEAFRTARDMLRHYVFAERCYVPRGRLCFIELPPSLVAAQGESDPWSETIRSIVIRSIFSTFFARVFDPSVSYKILVADEVWSLLRARDGRGYFDYANRAFRKHGAGLWVASQSMADFLRVDDPAFARAFVSNAYYKVLFQQTYSEPIAWVLETGGAPGVTPEDFWRAMAIGSSPGRYSEALLIEGTSARIVRLVVHPELYALFQTSQPEVAPSGLAA